ncbi:meprin A subunit alpha-like isoform X2 [Hemicordylus capensis]|uniref:meprin A subunit alpha-like isoform X2 n=1 Tax=Hemicordylus capensis TaxID=884348 RepID=UPI0023038654|nr:meprin A subunit alpha-like isoform X2 [Hemicordylus capensis]
MIMIKLFIHSQISHTCAQFPQGCMLYLFFFSLGCETNFMKSWNTNMLVAYDCSSIMHYGRNAFSMTGLPTTVPLSSSYIILGQRWNLSNSDIARVNQFYKCFQAAAQPGGYISLKSPTIQVPSKKAILISPVLHGTRCLKFWYRTMGSVADKINIYIKLLNSSEWHKVWSMKEDQGMDWYPVAIPISEIGKLQVALEGVTGHNLGNRAGIDDLLVCRKPCWECYNTKSILCGENKIN